MKPEDLTDLRRWAEAHPQSTQARQVLETMGRIAELESLVLAQLGRRRRPGAILER